MRSVLNLEERKNLAIECPGWVILPTRDAIFRSFIFENFLEAFACMKEIAEIAEQLNHHPEWFNVWNRLDITLSTHDSKGLTSLDIELAKAIDRIYQTTHKTS